LFDLDSALETRTGPGGRIPTTLAETIEIDREAVNALT
jgi:hypothetical protein